MTTSPATRLGSMKHPEIAKTRTLTDAELRTFWTGIVNSPVSRQVGLGLRLILLTGMRSSECAGLRIAELEEDMIHLPGERTKNGKPHLLPLPAMAREIIAEAIEIGGDEEFVFPSPNVPGRPMDGHAFAVAMRRFSERVGGSWAKRPTPHDLRRTLRTRLSALRIPREVCEAILNHKPPGIVSTYDQHEYLDEKRGALEAWARMLGTILDDKSERKVVAFGRR